MNDYLIRQRKSSSIVPTATTLKIICYVCICIIIYKTNKKVLYVPLFSRSYIYVCVHYIHQHNVVLYVFYWSSNGWQSSGRIFFFPFFSGKQTQLFTRRQATRFIFGFQYPGLVYFDSDTVHHSVLNFVQYIPLCNSIYIYIYITHDITESRITFTYTPYIWALDMI